jgi:dTDP-4-dehydrorhamnose 3,5-epimerase
MEWRELEIAGAWEFTPRQHPDDRGVFLEWFKAPSFEEVMGHPFSLAQANISVSKRGTVRAIHYAEVPPGQAKWVTCPTGSLRDFIIDIRVGSPTFGQHTSVVLDPDNRKCLYLSEGLGHGFTALEDNSTLAYLCSTAYNPEREHTVSPVDPALGIDWGTPEPLMSERDTAAPTLAEAEAKGILPTWEACQEWVEGLRRQGPEPERPS